MFLSELVALGKVSNNISGEFKRAIWIGTFAHCTNRDPPHPRELDHDTIDLREITRSERTVKA
jgi:hypothetical protein